MTFFFFLCLVLQAEMVAVEMDIQVACLDHMVGVTVAMAEQVVMHMLLLLMMIMALQAGLLTQKEEGSDNELWEWGSEPKISTVSIWLREQRRWRR